MPRQQKAKSTKPKKSTADKLAEKMANRRDEEPGYTEDDLSWITDQAPSPASRFTAGMDEVLSLIPFDKLVIKKGENVRDDFSYIDHPDLFNLAKSIATGGLEDPLEVYPEDDGTFTVHHGHRRYLAIRIILTKKEIPKTHLTDYMALDESNKSKVRKVRCIIRRRKPTGIEGVLSQLRDNFNAKDIDNIEMAENCKRLLILYVETIGKEYGFNREIGNHLGQPEDTVKVWRRISTIKPLLLRKCREIQKYGCTYNKCFDNHSSEDIEGFGTVDTTVGLRPDFSGSGNLKVGARPDFSEKDDEKRINFPQIGSKLPQKELLKIARSGSKKEIKPQIVVFWELYGKKCNDQDAKDIGLDLSKLDEYSYKPTQWELFVKDLAIVSNKLPRMVQSLQSIKDPKNLKSVEKIEKVRGELRTVGFAVSELLQWISSEFGDKHGGESSKEVRQQLENMLSGSTSNIDTSKTSNTNSQTNSFISKAISDLGKDIINKKGFTILLPNDLSINLKHLAEEYSFVLVVYAICDHASYKWANNKTLGNDLLKNIESAISQTYLKKPMFPVIWKKIMSGEQENANQILRELHNFMTTGGLKEPLAYSIEEKKYPGMVLEIMYKMYEGKLKKKSRR